MNKTILAALLAVAALAPCARAADDAPVLNQDVIKSSVTMASISIGTAFTQVDVTKMTGSFYVEVQNLSTEQVCCAFDAAATTTLSSAKSCVRIDTAPTSTVAGRLNWKVWKRFAQNLSLYCRSLKGAGGTAEIIVTQGK